ncbi:nuclease-related domain-containing protein [Bacillus sp. S3]|uniref:nuclease-related domain-containing protein n=1 Tax=Bacillus sp. S3 TaxID=486398 RepID=UPI001CC1C332|nr:nuclease-related domain-containing protein [Bacillus sp. S3]
MQEEGYILWRWKNINTLKNRDYSLKLAGLQAAGPRLSSGHPIQSVLAAKQAQIEAGIGGEERVAEVLRNKTLLFDNHILHDVSPSSDEKFQMDTNVLTPWYVVILEVKNIGGVLEFKENPHQLIRTREDGHKDGFESPIVQLERNDECLEVWLQSRNIRIPIYGAVVLAYPKQIVAVPPLKTTLLYPYLIPSFIKGIPRTEKKLDDETFNWLSAELLNSHQSFIPKPICETYKIPFRDFQPGVQCKTCGRFGMIKLPRTWECQYCKATDHLAHQQALLEWFLIFKQTITNRECRWFLQVDDIHTAKRIMQSLNLIEEGEYRYREYKMDLAKVILNQNKGFILNR